MTQWYGVGLVALEVPRSSLNETAEVLVKVGKVLKSIRLTHVLLKSWERYELFEL